MPSVRSDNSLISFLRTCKEKLHCQSSQNNYLLVSGNDSCDLDSLACSLAYAFFKQKKLGCSTVVLPLCNIRRQDMPLRTGTIYWLDQCGLPWLECIFIDDLFPPEATFAGHSFTDLVLVDHYAPAGVLANPAFGLTVSEVIDHHNPSPEDQVALEAVSGYKRIEPVGSCASLVTMELLFDDGFAELPPVIWKLLYGAILTDTLGLSELGKKAGRLTELDLRAANRIEDMISYDLFAHGLTRQDLFSAMDKAKFNVSGLSTRDLLRRDSKMATVPGSPDCSFLCCTVSGLDFQVLLSRADFPTASCQLCREHSARLLVGITEGCPMDDAAVTGDPTTSSRRAVEARRRGLFVFSPQSAEDTMAKELTAFLTMTSSRLMLSTSEPLGPDRLADGLHFVGVIGNPTVTRKVVLPLLVEFQRRWLDRQQNSSNGNLTTVSSDPSKGSGGTSGAAGPDPSADARNPNDGNHGGASAGGASVYDDFVTPLAPVLSQVGDCLADWLSPLTTEQRARLVSFRLDARAAPTANSLVEIYRRVAGGLNMDSVPGPDHHLDEDVDGPVDRGASQFKSDRSIPGGRTGRQWSGNAVSPVPRWSLNPGIVSTAAGPTRRQTVAACLAGTRHGGGEHHGGRLEAMRKHITTDAENVSSLSDGEMVKPGWLETEYLATHGSWLRGKLACASLDAVEGVSFSLFRRLSGRPEKVGEGANERQTAFPATRGLDPSPSEPQSLSRLDPVEMALWQSSLGLPKPTTLTSGSGSSSNCSDLPVCMLEVPRVGDIVGGRSEERVGETGLSGDQHQRVRWTLSCEDSSLTETAQSPVTLPARPGASHREGDEN